MIVSNLDSACTSLLNLVTSDVCGCVRNDVSAKVTADSDKETFIDTSSSARFRMNVFMASNFAFCSARRALNAKQIDNGPQDLVIDDNEGMVWNGLGVGVIVA